MASAQPALRAFAEGFDGYLLVGGDGSPYSCKMRAYLRYRRIPYRWVTQGDLQGGDPGRDIFSEFFPDLKAKVIPVLVRPDGTYANDSTPLILELEESSVSNGREALPPTPADALVAALLEDFADEWITKIMFEGRFHTQKDAIFGAAWQIWQVPQPGLRDGKVLPEPIDSAAAAFGARQVKRRSLVVGSSGWAEMERCLREICAILVEMYRAGQPFLFGSRPTNADFALFGQLRQLAADPLPSRIMHEYPAAWSWVWRMDELGGFVPPSWSASMASGGSAAAAALLRLAGETYVPFMLANAAAYAAGEKEVVAPLRGGRVEHRQPTFRYQAVYCLSKLRAQFQGLARHPEELARARSLLLATGCLALFEEGARSEPSSRL